MGFHKRKIEKGVYGELSKIEEELQEAYDAQEQGQDLMLLIELSDMIGAIEGVAKKKFGFNLEQLKSFARLRSQVAVEEEEDWVKAKNEKTSDPISTIEGLARGLLSGSGVFESNLKNFWKLKDGKSIWDIQSSVDEIDRKKVDPVDELLEMVRELHNIVEKKDK